MLINVDSIKLNLILHLQTEKKNSCFITKLLPTFHSYENSETLNSKQIHIHGQGISEFMKIKPPQVYASAAQSPQEMKMLSKFQGRMLSVCYLLTFWEVCIFMVDTFFAIFVESRDRPDHNGKRKNHFL